MIPFSKAGSLASLALALSCMPLLAQAPEWKSNCTDESCTLSRTVSDAKTGRPVATMLVVVPKDAAEPIGAGVALPLGIALEPGVRLIAGETTIDVPVEVCLPDGCRALKDFSDDEQAALTGTETVELRFFVFGNAKQVSLKIPTEGLTEGLAALRN